MSQVTVTINGRQFRMACEDGQEAHLVRLAADLDQRIDELRDEFRRDRRHAAHRHGGAHAGRRADRRSARSCAGSSEELAALQEARVASADHAKATQAAVAAALNAAAERIESITRRLNQTRGDDGAADRSEPAQCVRAKTLNRAKHPHGGAGRRSDYIGAAGLRGATESYPRGLIDPEGSCP